MVRCSPSPWSPPSGSGSDPRVWRVRADGGRVDRLRHPPHRTAHPNDAATDPDPDQTASGRGSRSGVAPDRGVRGGEHGHHPSHPAGNRDTHAWTGEDAATSVALVVYAVHNLAAAIIAIPAGQAADRWGFRPVLTGGFLVGLVAYLLLGITGPSVVLLGLGFVAAGLTIGVVETAEHGTVAETAPEHLLSAFGSWPQSRASATRCLRRRRVVVDPGQPSLRIHLRRCGDGCRDHWQHPHMEGDGQTASRMRNGRAHASLETLLSFLPSGDGYILA